jgi:hypothetical protein
VREPWVDGTISSIRLAISATGVPAENDSRSSIPNDPSTNTTPNAASQRVCLEGCALVLFAVLVISKR